MSSLEHGLRPNSAIYLGTSEPPHLTSQAGQNLPDPLDEPLELYPSTPLNQISRLAQLPSPPHTNSTSGSTGDKDSKDSDSIRTSALTLPVVAVHDPSDEDRPAQRKRMQNEDIHDNYDQTRSQNSLDSRRDPSPDKRATRVTPRLDRTASFGSETGGISKLDHYHTLALRSPSGISSSGLPSGVSPKGRTISLGRSGGSSVAAAMGSPNGSLTASMRHASLTHPQRERAGDVFDPDLNSSMRRTKTDLRPGHSHTDSGVSFTYPKPPGSLHQPSSSSSFPMSNPHSSPNSTSEDDRSTTPPAPRTPQKRLFEVSPGRAIEISPRQRLVSEPTSPRRLSLLRNEVNASGGGLRRGATGRLNTVDEGERDGRTGNGLSAKRSRGGIPAEFLEQKSPPRNDEDPMDALTLTLPPRRPPSSMDRQPSPGLYTSEGSPSLEAASSTLASPFNALGRDAPLGSQSDTLGSSRLGGLGTAGRRPRPAGLRNSYDRWGETYEAWEKKMQQEGQENDDDTDAGSVAQRRVHTEGEQSTRRPGTRSVVNETLKSVGLVRNPTTASVRRLQDVVSEGRTRTLSDVRHTADREDSLVASPMSLTHRDTLRSRETADLNQGSSVRLSIRDRSSSRRSTDHHDREGSGISAIERYGGSRQLLLSPNVRAPVTIHNTLNGIPTGESPAMGSRNLPAIGGDRRRDMIDGRRPGIEPRRDASESRRDTSVMDGRETPANLRAFKSNYSGAGSQPKAYTSPSGIQRILPPRPNTSTGGDANSSNGAAHAHHSPNFSTGNVNLLTAPATTSRASSTGEPAVSSTSGLGTNSGSGSGNPTQLLNDALYMFEGHVSKLPHSSTMPDTYNDVLRDAKTIVGAAVALANGLRAANAVCVDEMVEAEANSPSKMSPQKNRADTEEVADVWRRVEAEFRADIKVSDELVRALTSFMIGTGRMLRSASAIGANSANHSRMMSVGGDTGSISRISGTISRSESRADGSISRGVGLSRGGSSDGRRSVEGWTHGLNRTSIDGRRNVENPYTGERRSTDTHREDAFKRLTGGTDGSQGSGGGSAGSRDRTNRTSLQFYEHGGSRPSTSLSMIRDSIREDGSSAPRTFTSLSSKRGTSAQTPASAQKSLPPLPLPASGELGFPQTEDGGDRTPIELSRPLARHSTMPTLAVPPPLPSLPSESIIRRTEINSVGRHQPSNSITSASTTSTTKPVLGSSNAAARGSVMVPASSATATTAITPTTARPKEIASARSSETSYSKALGQNASDNGLQQVSLSNPPRKRTISTAGDDHEQSELPSAGSGSDGRSLPPVRSSSTLSSGNSAARSSRGSLSSPIAPSVGSDRRTAKHLTNRRTNSTFSGVGSTTSTNPAGYTRSEAPARTRLVQRMSSAGALNSASPPPVAPVSRGTPGIASDRTTDSRTEEERQLPRSSNRLSLNAALNRRPHISELLGRRKDDEIAGGESPSAAARERRERRLAGQSW